MKKRLIPLLAIFAIVFALVPADAQAGHCVRCRFFIDYSVCNWGTLFGSTDCEDWTGQCVLTGDSCNHQGGLAPLSSEYTVASVERLDEPEKPAETLVAQANVDVPQTAQR